MGSSREMQNVVGIVYGIPPKIWPWTVIKGYRADGCMAEKMTPLYVGKVDHRTTMVVHTSEGKVKKPAVAVRVTESHSPNYPLGSIVKELRSELRKLRDGTVAAIR